MNMRFNNQWFEEQLFRNLDVRGELLDDGITPPSQYELSPGEEQYESSPQYELSPEQEKVLEYLYPGKVPLMKRRSRYVSIILSLNCRDPVTSLVLLTLGRA